MKHMNNNVFLKETPSSFFTGRDDEPGRRLGEMIMPTDIDEISRFDCAIIGIPEYFGIVENGGRIFDRDRDHDIDTILMQLIENGGPAAVRKRLFSMTPGNFQYTLNENMRIADLGDIIFDAKNIKQALDRLIDVLRTVYANGVVPIIIGGGHHISLASIGALATQFESSSIGVTVVDAHCDFRPYKEGEIHSGIPFRYLHDKYENIQGYAFAEVGLRPERNAGSFIQELRDWGATLVDIDSMNEKTTGELITVNEKADKIFLSIDIDAFAIRGASAPYPGGLSAHWGREAAFTWGSHPKTSGMDILEVNPLIDADSSDLAAQLIWSFLCGVSSKLD